MPRHNICCELIFHFERNRPGSTIFGESHGASPGLLFAKPILGRCLHCYLVAMVQSSTIGDMQIEVAVSWSYSLVSLDPANFLYLTSNSPLIRLIVSGAALVYGKYPFESSTNFPERSEYHGIHHHFPNPSFGRIFAWNIFQASKSRKSKY